MLHVLLNFLWLCQCMASQSGAMIYKWFRVVTITQFSVDAIVAMNIPAVVYGLSCIFRPSRLRPTLTIEEFSEMPINIAEALQSSIRERSSDDKKIDIRALVIDKDNCFAKPYATEVWPHYQARMTVPRKSVMYWPREGDMVSAQTTISWGSYPDCIQFCRYCWCSQQARSSIHTLDAKTILILLGYRFGTESRCQSPDTQNQSRHQP